MNPALSALLSGNELRARRGLRDWMEQEVTVPEGQHERQLYSCDTRPWVAAVIPYLERYLKSWIAACPRTGKTLLAAGYMLWRVCEFGDTAQIVGPEEAIVADLWKDKIEKIMRATPRMESFLSPKYEPKLTVQRRYALTNGGIIRCVYNPDSIRSYDSSCLFATEAASFSETSDEADMITLAQRRQNDHPGGGRQLFESTHTRDTTRFAEEVRRGTDSRLYCPCPHCSEYFEAGARGTIEGWDVDSRDDVEAYMVCPACGGVIDESNRRGMLQSIRVTHKNESAEAFSVTVNWFHTRTTIQEVGLAEWDNAHNPSLTTLRDLLQNIYSIPVKLEDEMGDLSNLGEFTKELIHSRIMSYESGNVPPGVAFTVGAIDCQKDWLYWAVFGMGNDGTLYYLDWGTTQIVPYEHQGQVAATAEMVLRGLNETYALLSAYNPLSIWVDTSYKAEASDVPIIRRWCCKYSNLYAIAGRATTEFSRMKESRELPQHIRDFMRPSIQDDGMTLWFLDVDRLKTMLLNRFLIPRGEKGGVCLPSDSTTKSSNMITRHLTAEKPEIRNTKTGIEIIKWKKVKGRNDLLDLSAYGTAGCILHAAFRKDQEHPGEETPVQQERPQKKQKQKRVRRPARSSGFGF